MISLIKRLMILCIFITPIKSFAKAIQCEGYYINDNNDSIACEFYVPVELEVSQPLFVEIQKKIKCLDRASSKKHVITTKGVKRYAFIYNNKNYQFWRISFGVKKNSQSFVRIISTGFLTAYEYYSSNNVALQSINYNVASPVSSINSPSRANNVGNRYNSQSVGIGVYVNFLLQKKGSPLTFVDGLNFKSEMSEYFSDYPELADKVKKGVYTKRMMNEIVTEYNQHQSIK
jgi:hypothetical protein